MVGRHKAWVLATGLAALLSLATTAQSDWSSLLKQFMGTDTGKQVTQSVLSDSEIVSGLKEALARGVETAVTTLGQTDGFLKDELVRIAMPDSLKQIEGLARKTGQGRYVDEFVTTMNRAAEQAVPEAAAILGDSIREMSVSDAQGILNGPEDSATQYFRQRSEARLTQKFLPLVKQATDQAGVTAAYKAMMGKAGGLLSGFMNMDNLDLDNYVTGKAMDGLFTYIAIQEKQIRENPTARTTDLLKKVFGSK